MNKSLVMTAIADRIDLLYKVYCNPKNDRAAKEMATSDINELYNAYFELRGKTGMIHDINGPDSEACNVDSIHQIVNTTDEENKAMGC